MKYCCKWCKKTIELEMVLFFCPFCGKSYNDGKSVEQKTDAVKIVVGSNSEMTIENKYWEASRECLSEIGKELIHQTWKLKRRTSHELAYIPIPEEFSAFIADSMTDKQGISKKIKNYIAKIEKTIEHIYMEPEQVIQSAIHVNEWTENKRLLLDDTIRELSVILNTEFVYPDIEPEKKKSVIHLNHYSLSEYHNLIQVIHDSEEKVQSIIYGEDNSFSIPYAASVSKEEAYDYEPESLARELLSLSMMNYDFIFGEDPETFLLKFWDCIIYLAHVSNDMLDDLYASTIPSGIPDTYETYINNEIDAMSKRVKAVWEKIDIPLDKLYRSQTVDMVDVQQAFAAVWKVCIANGNL